MNPDRKAPLSVLGGLLLSWALFAPHCTQATGPDSLLAVYRDPSLPDSTRAEALVQAIRTKQGIDPEAMWALSDTLERFGAITGSKRYEGMGLRMKGIARLQQLRYAEAVVSTNQALRIFRQAGDSLYIGKALNILALAYGRAGDEQTQVKYLLEALTIAEKLGAKHEIAVTCFNLSAASKEPGANDRAIAYALRTVDLVENQGVELGIAGVHQNLAGMYLERGEFDRCREHIMKARAYNDPGVMVTNYSMEGKLEAALGDMRAAEAAYAKAMEFGDVGLPMDRAWSRINMGAFHAEHGDKRKAERMCGEGLALLNQPGSFKGKIEACKCLEKAYRSKDDYKRAMEMTDRVRMYEDSVKQAGVMQEVERYELRKAAAADSAAFAEKARAEQEASQAEIAGERLRKRLFMAGGAGSLVLAFLLWRRLGRTRREKAQSEEILYNVLPEEVAREIRETGTAKSRQIEQVTVLFTDFQGFTELSSTLSHDALMEEVGACFTAFDGILARNGVEKIKTIGDAYMAAAGLKGGGADAAARTVRTALEMQAFVEARHAARTAQGSPAFRMRVGIHTGPVVAGIVGVKKFQYDIWGDTVNTASRMESSGEAGKVNISEATYDAIKNDPMFNFTPRGMVEAKGKGEVEMWFVDNSMTGI